MLITTRKLGSISAIVCLLFVTNTGVGQQFERPSLETDRSRASSPTVSNPLASEHSILDSNDAASQSPALAQTLTRQSNAPIVSSTIVDDPFSASGIQRMEGSGEDATGTFATSDHMPMQSTTTAQGRGYPGVESNRFSSRGQSTTPPIRSNGLRSSQSEQDLQSGTEPSFGERKFGNRSLSPSANSMGMSFGDQSPRNDSTRGLASQPSPPQPSQRLGTSQRPRTMQTFGQSSMGDPRVAQQTTDNFSNNRFQGASKNAPPIHNSPPSMTQYSSDMSQPTNGQSMIQDSNISPTQYQRPVQRGSTTQQPETEKIDLALAKKIMKRYEIASAPDPLPGQPVTLLELLQRTPQHLQKQMIVQYWDTYLDWATVLNSTQYLDWLNQLVAPQNPTEVVLLNASKAAVKNQLLADEIQLGKSQLKLVQFAGPHQSQMLPLPSDQPLVQEYETQYDWYASRNRMPASMRGFNVMLPKAIRLVADRASTVGTSRYALSQIRTAYASNPRQLGSILEAARMWNNSEQNLVGSIVSYNKAIADYSLTIAGGYRPPQQIVSMLISKPKANIQSAGDQRQTAGRRDRSQQPARIQTPQLQGSQAQYQRASQQQRPLTSNNGGMARQINSQPTASSPRSFGLPPATGQRTQPRTLAPSTDLSPRGFTDSASPQRPSALSPQPKAAQPTRAPAASPPAFRPQQGGQAPAGDRSAFRGGQSGNNTYNVAPRTQRSPMSNSAQEFNSLGR